MKSAVLQTGAALLAAAIATSCGGGDNSRVETWEVNSNEQECFAQVPLLCLMTRASGATIWTNRYAAIGGFQYELGVRYTIKVRITPIENPPADAASEMYELKEPLSQADVPRSSSFELSVTDPKSIQKVNVTSYSLFGRRTMNCNPTDCGDIDTLLAQGSGLLLEFDHQNSPSGPMNLLRVKCSAPSSTFRSICLGGS